MVKECNDLIVFKFFMELIRLKYEEVIYLIVCIVVIVFVNGMNIFI